jgi:Glycosyltransferase
MKTIIIASLNGIENAGGLERITYYIYEILRPDFRVKIIKRLPVSFGKFNFIFQPLILSIRLFFIPNKIVISNSWHSFMFPADLSIHHGTMRGVQIFTQSYSRRSGLIAKMEALSARTAKKILAVSQNCKQELARYYSVNPDKIAVLNNFVDESIFYPCQDYQAKSTRTRIIFAGSLCKRKGLPHLIALAKKIETERDFEFIIASNDKPEAENFRGLTNTRVISGLNLNDMPSFYNSGDILFFPTHYEGFSMSTLEALACGIPVAGTSFAIPEELRDYDFCKDITENLDDMDFVLKQMKSLSDKYASQRQLIHDTVVGRFGKDQYRQTLLEYVRRIGVNT